MMNLYSKRNNGTFFNRIIVPKDKAIFICVSILFYVYFIGFFTLNIGLPESAYYVSDIMLLFCLFLSFNRIRTIFFHKRLQLFTILLLVLLSICTFSSLFNGFNLLLWMWSLRNWGRFFLYFYVCCALLNERWIDIVIRITLNVFFINTFVIVIQYFFMHGYSQDSLNGLVGRNVSGANIVLTMVAVIIITAEYVSRLCTIRKLLTVFFCSMTISVFAELKAIPIFTFVIFVVVFFFNSRFTIRDFLTTMLWLVLSIIIVILSLHLLVIVYPEFSKILALDGLIKSVSSEYGYGNIGYIDRLSAIKVINRDIFSSSLIHQLFGIGMGNAEYSVIQSLTSSFYSTYGHSYCYLNFCVAILYIEGGYIGFLLYASVFLTLIVNFVKQICILKHKKKWRKLTYYESIGLGMSCLGFIFIWYNNLLRTDMSLLMALYIAVPFAISFRIRGYIGDAK